MFHLLPSKHHLAPFIVALGLAVSAVAVPVATAKDTHPHLETKGVFEEVLQDLKDAIVNRGYVVDFVGHVDTQRTPLVFRSPTWVRVYAVSSLVVFVAFGVTGPIPPTELGLTLAMAVLLDATVVRVLLVPASMALIGERNWYLPRWLDRILPNIHFSH